MERPCCRVNISRSSERGRSRVFLHKPYGTDYIRPNWQAFRAGQPRSRSQEDATQHVRRRLSEIVYFVELLPALDGIKSRPGARSEYCLAQFSRACMPEKANRAAPAGGRVQCSLAPILLGAAESFLDDFFRPRWRFEVSVFDLFGVGRS